MQHHPQILNRKKTAVLIVDVQTRINSVMFQGDLVRENVVKLIQAAGTLGVPVFITEQYPKGLGPTEPAILQALGDREPIRKMTFSCCGADELIEQLKARDIEQVVVVGIETHICVQQTALDLLAQQFQVHLPKDVVSSRKELDHSTALERMSKAGVVTTTLESVLFELLEEAGTPEFKAVAQLIK